MKVYNWESKLFSSSYHIHDDKNTVAFLSGDSSDNIFGILNGKSYSFVNNGNITQIFENEGSKEVINIFCNNEKNQASFTYKGQPYLWNMNNNGFSNKSSIRSTTVENGFAINYTKNLFETKGQIYSSNGDPLLIFIGLALRSIYYKKQFSYLMIFLPLTILFWFLMF